MRAASPWLELEVHGKLVRSHISQSAAETDPVRKLQSLDYAFQSWNEIKRRADEKLPLSAAAATYKRKLEQELDL